MSKLLSIIYSVFKKFSSRNDDIVRIKKLSTSEKMVVVRCNWEIKMTELN